jgi:hypothetical protein
MYKSRMRRNIATENGKKRQIFLGLLIEEKKPPDITLIGSEASVGMGNCEL